MLYGPFTFGSFTGNGQVAIPPGIHSFQITIQSGSAVINGTNFWAPQQFQGGAIDSKMVLRPTAGIAIGNTGVAGVCVNYLYW